MTETQKFDIQQAITDAKRVIMDPFGFYKDLPLTGGLTNPMLFVVCMAVVMALISAVTSMFGLGMAGAAGVGIVAIILMPIVAVIGSFIGAAIMFVIWKLIGSDKDFEAAYRCVAYFFAIAPVVAIISIIPYVGTLIRALWSGLLMYAASKNAMGVKEQTAKIAIGILTAILVIGGINGERNARKVSAWADRYSDTMRQAYDEDELAERLENMTAEDAGAMVGDFLKGLEKAAEEAEKAKNAD